MAALTIRNLDDETKSGLRSLAARHGVSMEQEARAILRDAVIEGSVLTSAATAQTNWYQSLRALVEAHGGFDDLEVPPRSRSDREPPSFN